MLNDKYHIRLLKESDLEDIWTIEQTSYLQPWTFEQFKQELTNPVSFILGCMIENQLAGYLCYWWIAGEMQILNIATAIQFRRHGVAKRLLEDAFKRCAAQGLASSWLEVRASNLVAQTLYRQYGFKVEGCRRAYYQDGEDALVMVREFDIERAQESGK